MNNSRRPTNIKNDAIHFAKLGNSFHDIVGPISNPNAGPTFPNELSVIVIELVESIPAAIIVKAHTKVRKR